MKPLTADDILPLDAFREQRQKLLSESLAAISARRLALGPNMTLLFENRVTARWQIQEMCRVEGITKPEAVAHEIRTYNSLIPGNNELSATLLVEYDDPAERAEKLVALSGLDQHLWLDVDGLDPVRALFEEGREKEESGKISSVQFVRFLLTDAHVVAFGELSRPIAVRCSHPAYPVSVTLGGTMRGAMHEDLNAE